MVLSLEIFKHFILAFSIAFLDLLLSPGFLTVTVINVSIDRKFKESIKFAYGVLIPLALQVYLALLGADYFTRHPEIIKLFSKIAVFIFLIISVIFFHQYINQKNKFKKTNISIKKSFLFGFIVSLINPLAIPFYFALATFFRLKNILILEKKFIFIFVISVIFGAFTAMFIHAKYAKRTIGKIFIFEKYIKLLSALVMFLLAISSLLTGFFQ